MTICTTHPFTNIPDDDHGEHSRAAVFLSGVDLTEIGMDSTIAQPPIEIVAVSTRLAQGPVGPRGLNGVQVVVVPSAQWPPVTPSNDVLYLRGA